MGNSSMVVLDIPAKRGQKIRPTTLASYTTAIVYLNQKIGSRQLATFDNAEMKDLISAMENETREHGRRFTPKTIVNYYLIASAVFTTAKDRKGKQLFPRQWDLNYIGVPAVEKRAQNAPTVEAADSRNNLGRREDCASYKNLFKKVEGLPIPS